MATLNQIVYSIAERMPGVTTPNEVLLEMLKYTVVHYRSLFLRRDYADNLRYPKAAMQEVDVNTVLVDASENPILRMGYKLLRTVNPIPQPVRFKNWQEFVYVGGVDRITPYTMILPEEAPYRLTNKHTSRTPCFYYNRGYVYVLNVLPQQIHIQGVFADPRQLAGCSNSYDDDSEFAIPLDLLEGIITGILAGEYRTLTPPPSASNEVLTISNAPTR